VGAASARPLSPAQESHNNEEPTTKVQELHLAQGEDRLGQGGGDTEPLQLIATEPQTQETMNG